MTYIPGNPITGFSIDLDGDPDAVERVLDALSGAVRREVERASREQMDLLMERRIGVSALLPRWPFQGELRLRTME